MENISLSHQGARCSSRVRAFAHDAMGRWINHSWWTHWAIFLFQPVLCDWCNKGHGMCYPVCGMMHIIEPLLLIRKSGGSRFLGGVIYLWTSESVGLGSKFSNPLGSEYFWNSRNPDSSTILMSLYPMFRHIIMSILMFISCLFHVTCTDVHSV